MSTQTNIKKIIAIKGLKIAPVVFDNKNGAALTADPALPLGLYLSAENKKIILEGTPSQVSPRTIYQIAENHIEITVVEAPIKTQREKIIHENDLRGDLDTPRSQVENAMSDHAINSTIKPHEKFAHQPMGDDKRLSLQTENNPDAENRAQSRPELTPSPSAQLQAQATNAARPQMTPKPGA